MKRLAWTIAAATVVAAAVLLLLQWGCPPRAPTAEEVEGVNKAPFGHRYR